MVLLYKSIEGLNFKFALSMWSNDYKCQKIEWNTKVTITMSRIPPQSCAKKWLKPLVAPFCDIRTFSIDERKGTCTITGFAQSVESIPDHVNLGMSYPHEHGTNIKGFKINMHTAPLYDPQDNESADPGKQISSVHRNN
ncbi:hypothetical protein HU200_053240 [Digitaria exilis]|uniref:Uncharacterized protein n=1 Tax=Digitaria exilis TaxID=1010633 RepID=A0A835AMN9_9POAL|nr:hypothetical protein HU200_053240 [Digitaria exilis]